MRQSRLARQISARSKMARNESEDSSVDSGFHGPLTKKSSLKKRGTPKNNEPVVKIKYNALKRSNSMNFRFEEEEVAPKKMKLDVMSTPQKQAHRKKYKKHGMIIPGQFDEESGSSSAIKKIKKDKKHEEDDLDGGSGTNNQPPGKSGMRKRQRKPSAKLDRPEEPVPKVRKQPLSVEQFNSHIDESVASLVDMLGNMTVAESVFAASAPIRTMTKFETITDATRLTVAEANMAKAEAVTIAEANMTTAEPGMVMSEANMTQDKASITVPEANMAVNQAIVEEVEAAYAEDDFENKNVNIPNAAAAPVAIANPVRGFNLTEVIQWTQKTWASEYRVVALLNMIHTAIVVENLPLILISDHKDKLAELFEVYGPIHSISSPHIIKTKKGASFRSIIHFETEESAIEALKMDNVDFAGGIICVRRLVAAAQGPWSNEPCPCCVEEQRSDSPVLRLRQSGGNVAHTYHDCDLSVAASIGRDPYGLSDVRDDISSDSE